MGSPNNDKTAAVSSKSSSDGGKQKSKSSSSRRRSKDKRSNDSKSSSKKNSKEFDFPMFDDDEISLSYKIPGMDDTDCEESDEEVSGKYRCKEDQDVAMFMNIAKKMTIKSLLFLLQGHAKNMLNIPEAQLKKVLSESDSKAVVAKKKIVKKLRFAEIMGGQHVRVEVREIPHVNEFTKDDVSRLWWTDAEQAEMRQEAIKVVRYFKGHRPEYSESVEVLSESHLEDVDDWLVEYHLKNMTEDSFPRGLEAHIVKSLGKVRQASVDAVLDEQDRQDKLVILRKTAGVSGKPAVAPDECIRRKYLQASKPFKSLARKMAECDHVEALKSSISRWAS